MLALNRIEWRLGKARIFCRQCKQWIRVDDLHSCRGDCKARGYHPLDRIATEEVGFWFWKKLRVTCLDCGKVEYAKR